MIQNPIELGRKKMKKIDKDSDKGRRSGGRAARQALRSAPLARELRPVKPGLLGGYYNPLSQEEVIKIHEAALHVLEEIGLADAPESGVKAMTDAGAVLGEDGRLKFPRKLVEKMLSLACKDFSLHGRSAEHDLLLKKNRVHYGTAGAAVNVVDPYNKTYRPSEAQDIYNAACITEKLDNIHFFQRPMVATNIADPEEMDLNTLYACLSGTQKHVGISFTEADFIKPACEILHIIAGGEQKWRERPFISNSNAFVVPPMRFATESCLVMEECIKAGIPVLLLSAGQAGATAPASIAGTIAQATAEVLAGLVYVNSIKPGHPCIAGTWPFVSDLRTGAMSGGSGEQGLLSAACAQMLAHFNLPSGAAAGMCDSKLPDAQSGYEKGSTAVMAGLAGLNLVYESAGMHASLLGFSLESMVIDNDMLGQCLRCVRGIEVNPETLSFDAIKEVCLEGPGHYLGHDRTLAVMESEYVYPDISDRSSPKEWKENDNPEIIDTAHKEVTNILDNQKSNHISNEIDREIRKKFKIHFAN